MEIVSTLLDNHAVVNMRNNVEDTALLIACQHDWDLIAEQILHFDADVNHRNMNNETVTILFY